MVLFDLIKLRFDSLLFKKEVSFICFIRLLYLFIICFGSNPKLLFVLVLMEK
jgi:hypothetical protein